MNATLTKGAENPEPYDAPQDGAQLARRPQRQFFNKRSAALVAVITCAAGFYAGVRVEKGQVSDSGSGGSSLAAAIAAARGPTTSPTTGEARARGGSAASGAAGGLGALFARGGSAGDASFGTISGVNGKSLFVTTATGNVVKVKLTSATKISKSLNASRSALHPGDTVVIRGLTNSDATMTASSVSDSGASARGGFGGAADGSGAAGGAGAGAAGGANGAGGGSSGSSASSAISSLFSSGGSGG